MVKGFYRPFRSFSSPATLTPVSSSSISGTRRLKTPTSVGLRLLDLGIVIFLLRLWVHFLGLHLHVAPEGAGNAAGTRGLSLGECFFLIFV